MADIAAEIKLLCRNFSIKAGVFDQHMGYALLERLFDSGMKQFSTEHYTDAKNSEVYSLTKTLYIEGLLELPDHPIMIPELLQLEGEKKTKNKIIVEAPNKKGAHDDISDALVRAVWLCHTNTKERARNITSLAGPGGGVAGGRGAAKDQSYLTYQLDKQRRHGEHPRLKLNRNRLSAGAVRGHKR
jgi:phage terminase large subunit-like protein